MFPLGSVDALSDCFECRSLVSRELAYDFFMMLATITVEFVQNTQSIDQETIDKLFCHLLYDRAEDVQTGIFDDADYESSII